MTWQSAVNKDQIHPRLVAVMDGVHGKLAAVGTPFKSYSGTRTFEEQNVLYAKGRTTGKKGAIITKAKGGQSTHNYGFAVDSAPLKDPDNPEGNVHWPDPSSKKGAVWYALEKALQEVVRHFNVTSPGFDDGLEYEWGGRWKFRDAPHIQIRTTLSELRSGEYPYCPDVEWLVKAHTTFLFNTPWMNRRVQFLLNMQSYSAGVVDGIFGSRTMKALQAFQGDQNLEEGRDPNHHTVERLVRLHQTGMSTLRGTLPEDLVG